MKNFDELQEAFNAISGKVVNYKQHIFIKQAFLLSEEYKDVRYLLDENDLLKTKILEAAENARPELKAEYEASLNHYDATTSDDMFVYYEGSEENLHYMDGSEFFEHLFMRLDRNFSLSAAYKVLLESDTDIPREHILKAGKLVVEAYKQCDDQKHIVQNKQTKLLKQLIA